MNGVEIRDNLTIRFLVSETPCLSFPALEVVIELVIFPRLVLIISCAIIQGVWEHRAGRALWSRRDEAPGSTSAASSPSLLDQLSSASS